MWVIMVDHSGSMGDGFRKSAEQASFRDRRTQQTVKLQAAVESVLIELPRLPARSYVILCGFTSSARVLHRGPAGDQVGFATALQGLSADGGTNIAAALDTARTQASAARRPSPAPDLPEANRIMLITDGLSDQEEARQAARRCARDGLTVDVILIDPTDEAQELAAAVAGETNGRWEPVFGPEDLSRAAAEAREAIEIEAQQTGEAARAVAVETAAIRAEQAARDTVLFRASHPRALTADAWHPLFVHVYAERMEGELKARLAELTPSLGSRPRRAEVAASSAIAPGTELEIQPAIEHVRCRPPRIPVTWAEQLEEARFEITYAGPTGPGDVCQGDVLVLADGLVIAKIPVSFLVTADGEAGGPTLRENTVKMISQVFGSYARKDAAIVTRFRAAYRALGIRLFVDTLDIDAGMTWKKFVRDQIDASDLFQLFWSPASAASAEVADEWQHTRREEENHAAPESRFWQPKQPDAGGLQPEISSFRREAALASTCQGKEAALAQTQQTANRQAATLKQELGQVQVQANTINGDGTYVVGQDIESGTYHTNGSGDTGQNDCYCAALSSTDGSLGSIVSNGNFDDPETISLSGVYAFQVNGPCTWVLVP